MPQKKVKNIPTTFEKGHAGYLTLNLEAYYMFNKDIGFSSLSGPQNPEI